MRMSCDRSDGEPTTQAKGVTRRLASLRRFPAGARYYNRLEYGPGFRRLYAAARSSHASPLAVAHALSRDVVAAPSQVLRPRAFLSPLQVRESCHKQLRGVTPCRRGSAY